MSGSSFYLDQSISKEAWEIGEAFLKAILLEVSSYPKPGLVSSISMGAHKDMNILTFMVSSAAIAPAFYKCAQAGINHQGEISNLLPVIREIGLFYEKELLKSTKGVNTQRGILFAGGILSGAAGYVVRQMGKIYSDELFKKVSQMTEGLVHSELANIDLSKQKLTAGEQLYQKYKVKGIRGEVEAGFPSVRNMGLPAFRSALQKGVNLNYSIIHTLISLMTTVEDTTIIWRKDLATLLEVQDMAREILELGSVFTSKGLEQINKVDKFFIDNNISPGGSADLLSITISTYLLENKNFKVEIL